MPITKLGQLRLTMVAGISDNLVIAKNGDMPWGRNLKDDLRNFQITTSGPDKAVVMGRKTFESIGKPLSNRLNIILTRQHNFKVKDCMSVKHQNEVLGLAKRYDVYIIGGAEIYNLFLPYVNKMIITHVHTIVKNGDAFFPEIRQDLWKHKLLHSFKKNKRNIYSFDIVEYTKKP